MHGIFKRMTAVVMAIVAVLILMTGCGRGDGREAGETDAIREPKVVDAVEGHDELHIVTSFFPVYVAVINVTQDVPGVTVTNMTEPQTGCLHDYTLRPKDLKLIEKADVFVINGAGMEAFLDDIIGQHSDMEIIEASSGITMLTEENGEGNPHVWVSPTNSISYVNNIADRLSAIDIANADLYKRNAASYIKKLEALKTEMYTELSKLESRDIITFHEAFPYFAREFDLNIAAVVEREPGTEPTPKELAGIIDIVEQTGIQALFAEPQFSSGAAETIAAATDAVLYTLDPVVTGDAVPEAADAYLDAMRRNLDTLKEALG